MREGIVRRLRASHSSGLAVLDIEDVETQEMQRVYADNGPLMRCIDAQLPGFITAGHRVDSSMLIDKCVRWDYDEFGLCLGSLEVLHV